MPAAVALAREAVADVFAAAVFTHSCQFVTFASFAEGELVFFSREATAVSFIPVATAVIVFVVAVTVSDVFFLQSAFLLAVGLFPVHASECVFQAFAFNAVIVLLFIT